MLSASMFNEETMKKAEKIMEEKQKSIDLQWHIKLRVFDDIKIFNKCDYRLGMPKREFLKRLVNIRPYIRTAKQMESFENILKFSFNKLGDGQFDGNNIELKVRECETIMGILAISEFKKNAIKWIGENGENIGFSLLLCLSHSNMYLATETCYAATYLIRFMQSEIPLITSQGIIKGCIDIISLRSLEVEEYIQDFRTERRKQDDAELFVGKELPFHFPKFKYADKSKEKVAISCAIFTLYFLFHYNPHPLAVLFFQRRLYKRKSAVRYLLFTVLSNIIQDFKVELMEENEEWKKLPGSLYNDLARALNENNLAVKPILNDILFHLQEMSIIKTPVMTIHIGQAVDLYKQTLNDTNVSMDKHVSHKQSTKVTFKDMFSDNIQDGSSVEDNEDKFIDDLEYHRSSILLPELSNMIRITGKY